MNGYVKCPKCELNYMLAGEKCCKVCNPDMRGKLVSDTVAEYETYKDQRLKEYSARKESMAVFYSLRYNRKPC